MPREQESNGKFRVRLRKVSTPLPPPATGSSEMLIYPDALSQCRHGVIAVNPNDEADVILAATGARSALERLAQTEGVQSLTDSEAEAVMRSWSQT